MSPADAERWWRRITDGERSAPSMEEEGLGLSMIEEVVDVSLL
jgi:hypothetical protein